MAEKEGIKTLKITGKNKQPILPVDWLAGVDYNFDKLDEEDARMLTMKTMIPMKRMMEMMTMMMILCQNWHQEIMMMMPLMVAMPMMVMKVMASWKMKATQLMMMTSLCQD